MPDNRLIVEKRYIPRIPFGHDLRILRHNRHRPHAEQIRLAPAQSEPMTEIVSHNPQNPINQSIHHFRPLCVCVVPLNTQDYTAGERSQTENNFAVPRKPPARQTSGPQAEPQPGPQAEPQPGPARSPAGERRRANRPAARPEPARPARSGCIGLRGRTDCRGGGSAARHDHDNRYNPYGGQLYRL
jgi:hypothetical protein